MDQELEVKFFLRDVKKMQEHIIGMGGNLIQARVYECNLRFDTPERHLTHEHRVLRLRQDTRARLTYKGAAQPDQPVNIRQEIEFEVSDFAAARRLLEALDFEVSILYEKYRTTYVWCNVEIVVDEMPYGTFLEIEGPDSILIQEAAEDLGLNWEARCMLSYLALFERLKDKLGLKASNLSFAELAGRRFYAYDFGLEPADG